MHRPSTLENKYSNIFFYKTIARASLKFYMERNHGLRIIKLDQVDYPRWPPLLKIVNNKTNFFSRTARYFWLNFDMQYQWNIGIQNCKNEKKSVA